MEVHLSEQLVDFTSQKVKEISTEIKEELELEYDTFFDVIEKDIIRALSTPGIIRQFTSWQPLSPKWVKQKATSEHYVGLSNSRTKGNALGRSHRYGAGRLSEDVPRGHLKVGSFQSYIQSLNRVGTTARFFGPVSVSYNFIAPNPNLKVYPKQDNGIVMRTDVRNKGSFFKFTGPMEMSATITAFGNLKGVAFDEWHIVDYIIKRIDPANEKQWVKINSSEGIGGSQRPLRAVVTPILKYFMTQRFPKIVKDAITARR